MLANAPPPCRSTCAPLPGAAKSLLLLRATSRWCPQTPHPQPAPKVLRCVGGRAGHGSSDRLQPSARPAPAPSPATPKRAAALAPPALHPEKFSPALPEIPPSLCPGPPSPRCSFQPYPAATPTTRASPPAPPIPLRPPLQSEPPESPPSHLLRSKVRGPLPSSARSVLLWQAAPADACRSNPPPTATPTAPPPDRSRPC